MCADLARDHGRGAHGMTDNRWRAAGCQTPCGGYQSNTMRRISRDPMPMPRLRVSRDTLPMPRLRVSRDTLPMLHDRIATRTCQRQHHATMACPRTTMACYRSAHALPTLSPRAPPPTSGGRPAYGAIDPLKTQRRSNASPKSVISHTNVYPTRIVISYFFLEKNQSNAYCFTGNTSLIALCWCCCYTDGRCYGGYWCLL